MDIKILNVRILPKYRGIIYKEYLIIADLHLGYEISLAEEGIFIPRGQKEKFKKRIEEILSSYENIKKIIINGDFKHKFSRHSRIGWKEIKDFLEFLNEKFEEVIIIRGNHDTFLQKYEDKYFKLYDFLDLDNIFLTHGHIFFENLFNKYDIVIIGHEHPSIVLYSETGVKYKFPVFLVTEINKKYLITLPAFSDLFPGSNINEIPKEELLSPYLRKYLEDSNTWVIFENGLKMKLKEIKNVSNYFI